MQFPTTHWSVVLAAGHRSSPQSREALSALCQLYWPPLYAFIRQQGHDPHTAEDLAQEFLAQLLEKNYLATVDPALGHFRSFLLAAVRHFLANERDKSRAQKRGGGQAPLSLDFRGAENAYRLDPGHLLTAEKLFEKRWAMTVLEQVVSCLREEYAAKEQRALFDRLKSFLTGEKPAGSYAAVAAELNMTAPAVRQAVHRLRQRYGELLRSEIAQTVASPDDVEDEIRSLLAALGS